MSDNHFHSSGSPRFLMGVTGSMAASRVPAHLDAIRTAFGATITVVMTHTAAQFITPQMLRLSAERVVHGEDPVDWPTDRPSRLAGDHDLVIVLPATAHMLAVAAHGAAPNRLATVVLSSPQPSIFFPHMGAAMWEKPAVRRNVEQLRADGHHVVDPVWEEAHDIVTGETHRHPALPEPERVVSELQRILALRQDLRATNAHRGGSVS